MSSAQTNTVCKVVKKIISRKKYVHMFSPTTQRHSIDIHNDANKMVNIFSSDIFNQIRFSTIAVRHRVHQQHYHALHYVQGSYFRQPSLSPSSLTSNKCGQIAAAFYPFSYLTKCNTIYSAPTSLILQLINTKKQVWKKNIVQLTIKYFYYHRGRAHTRNIFSHYCNSFSLNTFY